MLSLLYVCISLILLFFPADGGNGPRCRASHGSGTSGSLLPTQVIDRPNVSVVHTTHSTQKIAQSGTILFTLIDYHNMLQVHTQEAQHVLSQPHARFILVCTRPHDVSRQHTAQICAITRFDPCPTRPYDHHTTQPTSAQSTHHHPCARPRSSCAMRQSPAHSTHAAHAAHAPHAAHARAARTHERDAHAQPTPASIIAHQRMPGQACLLETRDPESTI